MKRKLVLIISGIVLAAVLWLVVATIKPTPREPAYQGKTAQQWLAEVPTNQSAAMSAFRAMGTNALPVLVRAFEKRESAWDRFYRWRYARLPLGLKKFLSVPPPTDGVRYVSAELVALNVPHGYDEIRAMLRLMADANHPARFFVTAAASWLKPGDADCVPMLVECLKGTDPLIRWHAAQGLGQIGPEAEAALPALTAALEDRTTNSGDYKAPSDVSLEAAHAIWQIDHETSAPAKVCREALYSSDASTRGWALVYLSEIQPNDPTLMPQIIERLRGHGVFQLVAASQIGQFGPAANEAVPDLIKLADSTDWDLRHRARQSLKQIDPEAAAKFGPN